MAANPRVRVVVDGDGRYVAHAATDTVLEDGQRVVDLSPADIDRLFAGWTWVSNDQAVDNLRAFRDNPRMQAVLDLGPGQELTGNLLRNWAQDITNFDLRAARHLITLFRLTSERTNVELVEPGDDNAGPEA